MIAALYYFSCHKRRKETGNNLRWCHINDPPSPLWLANLKPQTPRLQIEIMLLQKDVTGETVSIIIMKAVQRLI
jgi:hypothetical protein